MPGSFWIRLLIIVLVHLIVIGLVKFPDSCRIISVWYIFLSNYLSHQSFPMHLAEKQLCRGSMMTLHIATHEQGFSTVWPLSLQSTLSSSPKHGQDRPSCEELSQGCLQSTALSCRALPILQEVAMRQQCVDKWVKLRPSISKSSRLPSVPHYRLVIRRRAEPTWNSPTPKCSWIHVSAPRSGAGWGFCPGEQGLKPYPLLCPSLGGYSPWHKARHISGAQKS